MLLSTSSSSFFPFSRSRSPSPSYSSPGVSARTNCALTGPFCPETGNHPALWRGGKMVSIDTLKISFFLSSFSLLHSFEWARA